MNWLYKLTGTIKEYDWGDEAAIPHLLNWPQPSKKPVAEYWLGAHNQGSAKVIDQGQAHDLSELIRKAPGDWLGSPHRSQFPYLVKLLSAKKTLSIQLHPDKSQAELGFNLENARGIPLDSEFRVFKDDNHKPELMVAITQFSGLCGFRPKSEILELIGLLKLQGQGDFVLFCDSLYTTLENEGFTYACRQILTSQSPTMVLGLVEAVQKLRKTSISPGWKETLEALCIAHGQFGNDVGLWFYIFLELITLSPGEGLYIPAGVMHAYISGLGLEVMANSDNVLRGGLTSKFKDVETLLALLKPQVHGTRFKPPKGMGRFVYEIPQDSFRVEGFFGPETLESTIITSGTPEIYVCTKGWTRFHNADKEVIEISRGEAVLIPAQRSTIQVTVVGELFRSWQPQ